MEVWSDRWSTCKFRNARSAFRNLHVEPLSLHTSMRNKQVESNPYIYTLSKLYRFGYEISVFWYKTPGHYSTGAIIRRYTVSCRFMENWMSNFSYVYRSRKHWECKYNTMKEKQVEFNPYSYTLSKLFRFFGYEISVFNTQQGGIQNSRRSRRLIRQGNGFTDEWISNYFLCSQ